MHMSDTVVLICFVLRPDIISRSARYVFVEDVNEICAFELLSGSSAVIVMSLTLQLLYAVCMCVSLLPLRDSQSRRRVSECMFVSLTDACPCVRLCEPYSLAVADLLTHYVCSAYNKRVKILPVRAAVSLTPNSNKRVKNSRARQPPP